MNNLDSPEPPKGFKRCGNKNCLAVKPVEDYHKDKSQKDGFARICKACQKSFNQAYARLHPEKVKETRKRSQIKDRPLKKDRRRKWRTKNPGKALLEGIKSRAKKLNVPFDLKHEDIVIPEFCPILGIKIESAGTGSDRWSNPSVDRIIPELGYTKENIAVMSYRANMIKSNGTAEEHERIAEWMRQQTKR